MYFPKKTIITPFFAKLPCKFNVGQLLVTILYCATYFTFHRDQKIIIKLMFSAILIFLIAIESVDVLSLTEQNPRICLDFFFLSFNISTENYKI